MITIKIPTRPQSVQDKKIRKNKHGLFLGNSQESIAYKRQLAIYAQQQMRHHEMIKGMVKVSISFRYKVPKSRKADVKIVENGLTVRKATRPDVDNLLKGIFDAMNGIVYEDDSQIVEIKASKWYSRQDEIIIEITEVAK